MGTKPFYSVLQVDIGMVHEPTVMIHASMFMDQFGRLEKFVFHTVDVLTQWSMTGVEHVILSKCERYVINSVVFDQHQSAYVVERLKSRGINANVQHITKQMHDDSESVWYEFIRSKQIEYENSFINSGWRGEDNRLLGRTLLSLLRQKNSFEDSLDRLFQGDIQ